MSDAVRTQMLQTTQAIQDHICEGVLSVQPEFPFTEDTWDRVDGGGGRSRVLQEGPVFEKAGVAWSGVHGTLPLDAIGSMAGGALNPEHYQDPESRVFFATGTSVVIHPSNPMAPTAHCNYRYFEIGQGDRKVWWFGGGADLTPIYLFDEDAMHFHQVHKDICDRYDSAFYPRFKQWCDEYFWIKHRAENRGIGGIFYDNLNDREPQTLIQLANDLGKGFVDAYIPLVARRKEMPFDEAHRRWQRLRRGRYVEFNLIYDRGTTFGLKSGGRTESILMSMPLHASWEYMMQPKPGSMEDQTLAVLKSPKEWTQ